MTFECICHWCGESIVRKSQATSKNVKVHFCDNGCKGEFQKTKKPVTREWLEDHYVNKRMDTTQIAHIVHRDPKSVWNWLKDFGIPRRPRGYGMSAEKMAARPRRVKTHKVYARKPKEKVFRSPRPGRTLSQETKDKIRAKAIGRRHSPEVCRRLSEIAKADGRRPYDPAVGSYMKGRKGADTPGWKGGISPERAAFYATSEWIRVSKQVKKRDEKTCQRCGKVKVDGDGKEFDIHHIVSFSVRELRATLSNLIYLCEPCHYWVHGKGNASREFIKDHPSCQTS